MGNEDRIRDCEVLQKGNLQHILITFIPRKYPVRYDDDRNEFSLIKPSGVEYFKLRQARLYHHNIVYRNFIIINTVNYNPSILTQKQVEGARGARKTLT